MLRLLHPVAIRNKSAKAGSSSTNMQHGHGKVGVCIVANCEVAATEGWADLQRAGMRSAEILKQYYQRGEKDAAIALHLIDLKHAEHDGWLALHEYAGAAKCSLMIEQLRYELGDSSAVQMTALCAISDHEIELSDAEYKKILHKCRDNNRWVRQLPVCCSAPCCKPLPTPLRCAQCKVAVYCDKACQVQVLDPHLRVYTCCCMLSFLSLCCHFRDHN